MWSPLTDGLHFLINTLFTVYLFVMLVRIFLQAVNADYYNPLCQFVGRLTQPIVGPIQHILPRSKRIDVAALIMLLLLTILKNWILLVLLLGASINWLGLIGFSALQIVEMAIQFYFFAIIIQVIISWIQPTNHNPFINILFQLTEPVLAPARRLVPVMAGFDVSPLLVIIGLQLVNIVLVSPLLIFTLQYTVGVMR